MSKREDIEPLAADLQALLKAYRDAGPAAPDDGFYAAALHRATTAVEAGTAPRRHVRFAMFGGAIAAGVALWIVSAVFFRPPEAVEPALPGVTMSVETPQTINLVFSSATPLESATMTVTLPEGVEISGFAGQREITWLTSLNEGRNVLPLTLIATTPAGGELLAKLQHGDDARTFRLRVSVI